MGGAGAVGSGVSVCVCVCVCVCVYVFVCSYERLHTDVTSGYKCVLRLSAYVASALLAFLDELRHTDLVYALNGARAKVQPGGTCSLSLSRARISTASTAQYSQIHQVHRFISLPVSEESSATTTTIPLAPAQGRRPSITRSPCRVWAPKSSWQDHLSHIISCNISHIICCNKCFPYFL